LCYFPFCSKSARKRELPGEAAIESQARRNKEISRENKPSPRSLFPDGNRGAGMSDPRGRRVAAIRTAILVVVAGLLVIRSSRLARPAVPLDSRNEQRFYGWAFGTRGLALHRALADKELLLRDGEVVCFGGETVPSGLPWAESVMPSYLLPRQIVLVPAARASAAADRLPCRTRIVVPPDRTLRIERRPLVDRRP
jgi:hypothetical protein